ncbi:MAG: hypothetical protein KJ606_09735, partial [Chloroflexi bacterium]|nr:hypothetical protein [Chloroflexota bacterium]
MELITFLYYSLPRSTLLAPRPTLLAPRSTLLTPHPMRPLFLSPSKPRLRAGWRLLIQSLIMLLLGLCIGIPVILLPMMFEISPHG